MKTTPMRTNESAAGSTRLLHRLTAALLALVLAASAALPVFAADTAPTDTIYINSVSDLLAFADKCGFDQWSKGKTVILQEDLSLEDTEWAPVASFSGAFKGNGHTISDVSLVGAYSPAGFFGILEEGGSIQDLTIKGVVNPAGTQKTAGGLVGTNYGTIINCTFSGAVHGEEEAGGLVGRNETSGTIDHSTSVPWSAVRMPPAASWATTSVSSPAAPMWVPSTPSIRSPPSIWRASRPPCWSWSRRIWAMT